MFDVTKGSAGLFVDATFSQFLVQNLQSIDTYALEMTQISDLILDSQLDTYFLPDSTVNTHCESNPTGQRRVINRSEHWQRQRKIGGGGFGTIWLEKCSSGGQPDGLIRNGSLQAVKQMAVDQQYGPIDYHRELEAIAKFSHKRVCLLNAPFGQLTLTHLNSMNDASSGRLGGTSQATSCISPWNGLKTAIYLGSYIKQPPLPEAELREIACQILEGLAMMHENGFAHRDLKLHVCVISC